MRLITTCRELVQWRRSCSDPVHFVPTMGALHRGHRSLIERAGVGNAPTLSPQVVVSVFVNPLQFAPGEDFDRYPANLNLDAPLAEAAGAAVLFAPTVAELYPSGVEELFQLQVPAALQAVLCGRRRPGHFNGVATVVARLLGLVRPDRLLLGEKDWQQLVILRRLANDLGLPVAVQGCATVRDADGLAASSRNSYLQAEQRARALALPQTLAAMGRQFLAGDTALAPNQLVGQTRERLEASGFVVDYVELVQAATLLPLEAPRGVSLLAAAVFCGPARLIDHTVLMARAPIVAIDGPAGAGKSTVTRAFARRLGLIYLDTGAMYRAVTWWVQSQGADPAAADAVAPLLENLDLRLSHGQEGEQLVSINGHEVSTAIRSPEVTAQVSVVAAHGCVRQALTHQQRAMGERGGLVAEGRDIGTAVFPAADLKVFLTATVAERARRRALDLERQGFSVPSLSELEAQIADRDHRDASREVSPLRMADDAVELVSDGLGIEAVIQALVDLFRERVPEEAWPDPAA